MIEGRIRKISLIQRRATFKEVSCGFSRRQALIEAKRCLQCKNPPCINECPVNIDIREFIGLIVRKDYQAALSKIREKNTLAAVCGRVCPQEELCQQACVLNRIGKPVKIGYLERFVADYGSEAGAEVGKGRRGKSGADVKKVAVVGSGPAGLTCAGELAKEGFSVSVFEALHKTGGVLVYGIPQFRLPKSIIEKELEYIQSLGVEVYTNFFVGKTKTIEQLREEGFSAFFIGAGAGAPLFLNIDGENLNAVYSANEFLTRVNLMKAYLFPKYHTPLNIGRRVGVIGAGNVAFDCARSALRLGAGQVHIIYRRTDKEMPAREEEIKNAREEGVKFKFLTSPVKILPSGNGGVLGIICRKNELGEVDSSGRRSAVAVEGSDFTIGLDMVIIAVGTEANPFFTNTISGLELTDKGYVRISDDLQTSVPDIFAGGDIVSGSATVISAIQQGKAAGQSIKKYLERKS